MQKVIAYTKQLDDVARQSVKDFDVLQKNRRLCSRTSLSYLAALSFSFFPSPKESFRFRFFCTWLTLP